MKTKKVLRSQTINLLTLRDEDIWNELVKCTVRGWRARDIFRLIRYGHADKFLFANIRVIRIDSQIAAWGLNIFHQNWSVPELQLYTLPKFRKQGLQKKYIIPYWNKHSTESHVSHDDRRQRAAFEYFVNQPTRATDIRRIQIP